MSLNGLDSPAVQDAYQAAATEAGGWFLLRYTNRDSVELLSRGRNGVSEARNAISGYSEASPLYGLIMYRRRKILIKYIPEGTSRLLQARTAVHFSDVLERYSPYETLLEISTGEALNDTALAASFQLHTASPSPSPSSRLDEIREDGEDSGSMAGVPSLGSGKMSNAQRYKAERRGEHMRRKVAERPDRTSSLFHSTEAALPPTPAAPSQRASTVTSPLKPSVSQFLVRDDSGHTSITPLEAPFARESGVESRASDTSTRSADSPYPRHDVPDSASQSTAGASESTEATEVPSSPEKMQRKRANTTDMLMRELPHLPTERQEQARGASTDIGERATPHSLDIDDPYGLRKYDEWFKPKVKLGPRPVATPDKTKKPTAARVSALPANFKPVAKKQEPARPKSSAAHSVQAPSSLMSMPFTFSPTPPPIPDEPAYSPRPVSRGSVKSAPSHKPSGMTPDKLRLMKALELRKKQLSRSQEQPRMKVPVDQETPTAPKIPDPPQREVSEGAKRQQPKPDHTSNDDQLPQSNKADSGIQLREETKEQDTMTVKGPPLLDKRQTVEAEPGLPDSCEETTGGAPSAVTPEQSNIKMEELASHPKSDLQGDAMSSSESIAATERPTSAHQDKQEVLSVPIITMADGSAPTTSSTHTANMPDAISDSHSSEGHSSGGEHLEEPPSSPRRQNSDLARRRRGFVEPLHVDVTSGNPDDFVSDDDELLEELHSATLQEAKPIVVSRSQLSPAYLGRRPSAETPGSVRSVNITRSTTMPAEVPSATLDRLAAEPSKDPRSPTSPIAEKHDPMSATSRNVSSGISKRIQALAEMSSRPSTADPAQQELRRPPHKSRPTSFRRQSANRGLSPSASNISNENATVWNVQHDPVTNRNSVSVTARIVRPRVIDEVDAEHAEYQPVNRSYSSTRADVPAAIDTSRPHSVASSPALSPALSQNSGEHRQLHSGSRFGRHKQPPSPGIENMPSKLSSRSSASVASNDETPAPKEGSKTSRFLKRMSNINFYGSNRRSNTPRSAASSASLASVVSNESVNTAVPLQAQSRSQSQSRSRSQSRSSMVTEKADMPPAVLVGDLNVQFPDSLLWKRRLVTIDESGNLQFAIAQAMEIHKGVALKQFPLSDLLQPYAPDLDVEELAHSLVLECQDGTSLQLACEDAMTQRQVLHLLSTYWNTWTAANP